jgi:hypothetical protein
MRPAPGWGRGPECPTSPFGSVRPRFLSPWSRWRRAVGWCGPGLARRAGQPTLEGGEGVDDGRRLEGPIPSSHVDLAHDAGSLQPLHRLVGGLEAAPDEIGRAADRDDRGTGEGGQQALGRRSRPDPPERGPPLVMDVLDRRFERGGIVNRSTTGGREQRRWSLSPRDPLGLGAPHVAQSCCGGVAWAVYP